MEDAQKTKEQLVGELTALRRRVAELEKLEAECEQAEGELRKSEEKLCLMFNSVTDGILVTELNGVITEVNDRVLKMHGFVSKDELLGKNASELTAPIDRERVRLNVQKTLEGDFVKGTECTLLRADGSVFPVELSTGILKDASGNPIGFITIGRDLTERKQAEKALYESEEKYRSLVKNVSLGIFRSTPGPTGRFLEVNPAMEKITGYSREELLQMNVCDLYVSPEERESVLEEIALATETVTKELNFKKKDGTQIVVSDTKAAVRDSAGKVLYFDGIIGDITERKQMQEKLMINDRLASLGELASGIAHQLDSPLTSMVRFAELLLEEKVSDEAKENVAIIHHEAKRAADVVRNLLTFTRKHTPSRESVDINGVIVTALALRAYEQRVNNIKVKTCFSSDLPRVMADGFQLQQVFFNIIINAEYFMARVHGGGNLTITTERAGDSVRVIFADDGSGISNEPEGQSSTGRARG